MSAVAVAVCLRFTYCIVKYVILTWKKKKSKLTSSKLSSERLNKQANSRCFTIELQTDVGSPLFRP